MWCNKCNFGRSHLVTTIRLLLTLKHSNIAAQHHDTIRHTWITCLLKLTTMLSARQFNDLDFVIDDLSRDLTRSACVRVTSLSRGWFMTSVVGADLNCATVSGVVLSGTSTTHNEDGLSLSFSCQHDMRVTRAWLDNMRVMSRHVKQCN